MRQACGYIRKAGVTDELRRAQKETVGLAKGGQPYQKSTGLKTNPVKPTLASQGIDKSPAPLSSLSRAMRSCGSVGCLIRY
jgi:hypothetical protein